MGGGRNDREDEGQLLQCVDAEGSDRKVKTVKDWQ